MITRYIQLGDTQQCEDNSVKGWEFVFGVQTFKDGLKNHAHYQNNTERNRWYSLAEHRTTFLLELRR